MNPHYSLFVSLWKALWTYLAALGVVGATDLAAYGWPGDWSGVTSAVLFSLVPALWRFVENLRKNYRADGHPLWEWKIPFGSCLLLMVTALLLVLAGCTTATSVQTPDGVTTETTSYSLNTQEISSLVGIGQTVWQIIDAAQGNETEASNDPSLTDYVSAITSIIGAFSGGTKSMISEQALVEAEAREVALQFYDSAGAWPKAGDVAIYVAKGARPTEADLKAFAGTAGDRQ